MAINSNAFTVYGSATSSNDSITARKTAVNQMMKSFFDKVNSIFSKDFVRVDSNSVNYDLSTNYYYRETYAVPSKDNKYIVVQFKPINYNTIGQGNANYDQLAIGLYITDSIVSTSTTSMNSSLANAISSNVQTTSTLTNTEGIVNCNIAMSAFILNFYNDSISLYRIHVNSAKTNLFASIGKCNINDNDYIVYTGGNATTLYWTLWNNTGTKLYTSSIIIATYVGTDSTDYIMTLPIYLSSGTTATTLIYKDLKLENALQCPNNACSYGGIYNIGGVDYFAIGNNFLLKM